MAVISSAGREAKKKTQQPQESPANKKNSATSKDGERWADKADTELKDVVPGQGSQSTQEQEDPYADRVWILPLQEKVCRMYDSQASQVGVACVIFLNFFISMGKAQTLPEDVGDETGKMVFLVFEYIFNIIFGIELIINLYSNWLCPFWTNGWNVFDFVIVLISWLSMVADNLPGISVLRLFRAFRVFRLFKRIPSLRMIIIGIIKSLPGIANAGVVLALIMGMWAVMGVTFFGEEYPDEFGCFTKAVLTCIQMMTYDSWVSGISRPIILYYQDWKVPFYFISYAFFTAIIMANVLIAILVDKYTEAVNELEAEEEDKPEIVPTEVQEAVRLAQAQITDRIQQVKEHVEELGAKMPEEKIDIMYLPYQALVKQKFEDPTAQVTMALVISVNFIGSAVQMQLKPLEGSATQKAFDSLEIGFNTFFLIELIVNMYGSFWWPFWRSGWNIFDFAIVIVGWMAMLAGDTNVAILRMFRAIRRSIVAFRVVKLLRMKQLKIIVIGVMRSITGVSYAFLLLGIVMGIWSIMGVDFFGAHYDDEFGNFAKAMLTMTQIMTFDSWSSGIARPIVVLDERSDDFKSGLFFISYIFISAIIMANVVLAILIDNFLSAAKEVTDEDAQELKERKQAAGEEEPDHCCLEFTKTVNMHMEALELLIKGPLVEYYTELGADVEYCKAAAGTQGS